MGGEGSGRKVDPNKAFLEQTPVGHTEGGTVIMPDYSGVSSHERTLIDFDARYSGAVALSTVAAVGSSTILTSVSPSVIYATPNIVTVSSKPL